MPNHNKAEQSLNSGYNAWDQAGVYFISINWVGVSRDSLWSFWHHWFCSISYIAVLIYHSFELWHNWDARAVIVTGYLISPWTKRPPFHRRYFQMHFSWMKSFVFWLKFHGKLFLRIQLTITKYWFRWWLGAEYAASHYLNQCWPKSLTHICSTGMGVEVGGGGGVGGGGMSQYATTEVEGLWLWQDDSKNCALWKHGFILCLLSWWACSCEIVNALEHLWWEVNFGSGNGLVPCGTKPLTEPMLTQICVTIWHHWATTMS